MYLQSINSPFNDEQAELVNRLVSQLSESQKLWLSGYLAASSIKSPSGPHSLETAQSPLSSLSEIEEVTLLYGSQTGNAQGLCVQLADMLEGRGFQIRKENMQDFKHKDLKNVKYLFVLVSTHGEGDPPDSAISFYEFLHSRKAPKLEGVKYSVLSLGDSSYEFFCQTGKDIDKRLEELGGERICPRMDCDLDYDEPAAEWFEQIVAALEQLRSQKSEALGVNEAAVAQTQFPYSIHENNAASAATNYSRTNPFQAEIIENINLNGRGSDTDTRHIELSLEGSGLQYEPGDCVGIYPQNHPDLVDEIIEEMNWDPDELVQVSKQGDQETIRESLLNRFEISALTKPVIQKLADAAEQPAMKELINNEKKLRNYVQGRDFLDLVRDYSLRGIPAAEIAASLRKMPARQYSIASSFKANPDEAHLTIKAVRYHSLGRDRYGVCSVQCADRLEPGDRVPIYIHHNPNFKLPENPDTPIIMIGPGTGVAPFRAFMEEREELGADGKSWLFFGNRHFLTDFLYQTDWQRMLKEGVLTRMDVAFSRDTAQKVYVQHRMLERGKELFEWLEEGAAVYVCGDEKHMANDVHRALQTIIEREGGLNTEAAEAYLAALQQQKRYLRDVY